MPDETSLHVLNASRSRRLKVALHRPYRPRGYPKAYPAVCGVYQNIAAIWMATANHLFSHFRCSSIRLPRDYEAPAMHRYLNAKGRRVFLHSAGLPLVVAKIRCDHTQKA